jgi:hypothetical protein
MRNIYNEYAQWQLCGINMVYIVEPMMSFVGSTVLMHHPRCDDWIVSEF